MEIVNDTGGHLAGDQLLRQLGELLHQQPAGAGRDVERLHFAGHPHAFLGGNAERVDQPAHLAPRIAARLGEWQRTVDTGALRNGIVSDTSEARTELTGEAGATSGLGLGLRNLRERLAAQYGGRAHVQWGPAAVGFAVEITLPFEAPP